MCIHIYIYIYKQINNTYIISNRTTHINKHHDIDRSNQAVVASDRAVP